MNVLVIGNILKDVYLCLDEHSNNFEVDERKIPWLDLAFDGSSHRFFRRTSIFSGATISLEVLSRFDHTAQILGSRLIFKDGEVIPNGQLASDYRYIFCRDDHISYFSPSERKPTVWTTPMSKAPFDWIFIDRSAELTDDFIKELRRFLSMSSRTRLAIYAKEQPSVAERELYESAELVFVDGENIALNLSPKVAICKISDAELHLGAISETWHSERAGLMTNLTLRSVLAASILAALLRGKTVRDALILAKLNAEQASLSGTLNLKRLEELAKNSHSGSDLKLIAAQLVAPGKGILATDESGGSIHKKFEQQGIIDDETHRRDYRNVLLTTPNLEKYITGVILFDETTHQQTDDGQNFVSYLSSRGIIPGIKVDQGLQNLPGSEEKYTAGLDGLSERLAEYYARGLRFAKWRAAFEITENSPTDFAISKNAAILAEYAKECQRAGLVPVVEPEVVHDGDYSIEICAEKTGQVLDAVFDELDKAGVRLDACLLKCNMVLAGKRYPITSTPAEVGRATAEVLKAHVPETLAGVVFLSGGQSVAQATDNLRACAENGPYPWPLTFSFSRALQNPALEAWAGNNANTDKAQAALTARLTSNVAALKP